MIQILIGLVLVGLLAGGVYVAQRGGETSIATESTPEVTMVDSAPAPITDAAKKEEMISEDLSQGDMTQDEKMSDDTKNEMASGDQMTKEVSANPAPAPAMAAQYVPYSSTAVSTYAAQGDVVLFFRAGWCPSCRALDADIVSNIKTAPAGLTILDVNYDTATELRQRYGVTTQHTLVQIAADGTLIKKWSGGSTLASVVAQVE
jgi:thiol-disulfide isomerase/thioredoxin